MASTDADAFDLGLYGTVSSFISRALLPHFSNVSSLSSQSNLSAMSLLDATVSSATFSLLDFCGIDINRPSPITKDLPFVSSPTPVIASVAVYLTVVAIWSRRIKSCADSKHPVKESRLFQSAVVAHNVFLCLLSLFMGSAILLEAFKNNFKLWGNLYSDDHVTMGRLIYVFYISKLYEFIDTVIILSKKNLRQVSHLHVYHHASISIIWWILCFRCPGGDAYFSAAFNSWIHVIMYSYYLLAAAIGKNEKLRRKYLFWGKYLTMLQMVQFMSFILQAAYGMVYSGVHPRGVPRLLLFYSMSLLLLFLDFFVRKHISAGKRWQKDLKLE